MNNNQKGNSDNKNEHGSSSSDLDKKHQDLNKDGETTQSKDNKSSQGNMNQ